MDLKLKDKVFLVTGGASGIGEAIVRTLAEEGARPVVFDLKSEAECPDLAAIADFHTVDLTDQDAVVTAIGELGQKHGRIDGIVNNAGVNDGAGFSGSVEQFENSLRKNLTQCFSVVHAGLDLLKKSDAPAMLNIASKVALTGQGGTSGYAASKGGLLGLTREWALDLAADSVRVNAIAPAEVWTPLYEAWISTQPDPVGARKAIEARIPFQQRMTTVNEIADMAAFLLSPRSSHTTGQIIHVDGGYVHFDRSFGL